MTRSGTDPALALAATLCLAGGLGGSEGDGALRIFADHPGGNGRVLRQDGRTVRLAQEAKGSGHWFYWNIRIERPAAGTYRFEFTDGEVIGPHGPAISRDGASWRWAGAATLDRAKTQAEWIAPDAKEGTQSFTWTFAGDEESVWFAHHLPYQLQRLETVLAGLPPGAVERRQLGTSEGGRPIPLLVVGGGATPERRILVTCRHHACESHASYVLEGILRRLAAEPIPGCAVHLVPMVDIDGVERGDQGKVRQPRDHNRDYDQAPRYRATRAMIDHVAANRFDQAYDLHCPGMAGHLRYHTHFYNVHPQFTAEYERFRDLLRTPPGAGASPAGQLYDGRNDRIAAAATPDTFSTFMAGQGPRLVLTLEQNYFTLDRPPLEQDELVAFGDAFARAMTRYNQR